MKKRKLVKKSIYFDEDEVTKLAERCKNYGYSYSKRIRMLIEKDNLKPILDEFFVAETNYTKNDKTRLKSTSNEE